MANIILDNTYLILLLPLWIFLIIMGGRFFSVYVNKKIIYLLTLLSSFLGIVLCSVSLTHFNNTIEQSFPFIKINNFMLNFGLHVDKLSLIFALILFVVSFLVQVFSISFMKDEPKNYRFFAFLNMFNFSMAGLLFSPNLFQMYVFWELVGVMSYLLIGFEYKNKEKSEASRRVFLMNRVGDTAFLTGIILTSYFMFNYAGNMSFTTLSFEDFNAISTLLYAYTSTSQFYIICSLFMIGAFVKSAQFPFYNWLQDAMEAKLPVSALLHSATMVAAGVYLLARLLPFFTLENNLMRIISVVGLGTAILCSVLACIETHPKKVLAYSTSANLGLMFLALASGNTKGAIAFFVAHAFIKAMLFMLVPSHNIKGDKIISYADFVLFLLGALSLSGIIFSGMVSKEIIFGSLNGVWGILFCVVAFISAFYIIRLSILIVEDRELVKEINYPEFLPSVMLFILNILFYFCLKYIGGYKIAEPFYSALAGWIGVYLVYKSGMLTMFSTTPKILEKIYNIGLPLVYEKTADVCNFVDTKIFANYKPLVFIAKTFVRVTNWVETNVMMRTVTLTASVTKKFSQWDLMLQGGNVQTYNAYAFILITIVISFVIIGYTFMLSQFN